MTAVQSVFQEPLRIAHTSLRRRLVLRLLLPLLILLVIGAVVTFILARHIGAKVYDRWLYDSAMTIADQLRVKDNRITLDLPRSAMEMFEWDNVDRIYLQVTDEQDQIVYANASLPKVPELLNANEPQFYDALVNRQLVRVVAVSVLANKTQPVLVQVAETINKRQGLLKDILLITVPLQVLILLVACVLLWLGLSTSLRSVDQLATLISGFQPEKLPTIPVASDTPSEVLPLVNALNALMTKVDQAQQSQRRFVANAAHQLRTPLAALQVQTERALREKDPHQHATALEHVLSSITRARHMTHQLLTLARTEKEAQDMLKMGTVNLKEVVREQTELWADLAIEKHIDIGYEGPDTHEQPVEISGEPVLLRELLSNLIDNAIRYGKPNGVVTVGLSTNPVEIWVEDDGPGIPTDEQLLVLEPFYRRAQSGGDGCGLGLAIAREIAHRHGANLLVQTPPNGQGTRIRVVWADA